MAPSVPWTGDEEMQLGWAVGRYGTRWQLIEIFFPRRTRHELRAHWQVISKDVPARLRCPRPLAQADTTGAETADTPKKTELPEDPKPQTRGKSLDLGKEFWFQIDEGQLPWF
jgi:hypothetical protein